MGTLDEARFVCENVTFHTFVTYFSTIYALNGLITHRTYELSYAHVAQVLSAVACHASSPGSIPSGDFPRLHLAFFVW